MKDAWLLACLLWSIPVFGQAAKLQIQLDHLAAKAENVVNVNLDGAMIEMGRQFLSGKKDMDADVRQMIESLQGVYVRVFEFAQAGAYTPTDLQSVKSQLSGPGWVNFVDIREKNGETVGIYSHMEGGKVTGLTVLAAEPKELTVVNIVGPIDLSKLGKLGGQLGIPDMRSIMKPPAEKAKTSEKPGK